MKHGPNALIDENLPVVIIATRDTKDALSMTRYEKTCSNLKEVKARSGMIIALATEGDEDIKEAADHVHLRSTPPEELLRFLRSFRCNCCAYHIAVRRGCDVDQPGTWRKSVTVE
jgi:glucosamine--fructose-6-phosphate aminotransferase (isomerizing)